MMAEPTNNERARWANSALAAYVLESERFDGEPPEDEIFDLLTDLGHLCDVHGLSAPQMFDRAKKAWRTERREQPKADASALE